MSPGKSPHRRVQRAAMSGTKTAKNEAAPLLHSALSHSAHKFFVLSSAAQGPHPALATLVSLVALVPGMLQAILVSLSRWQGDTAEATTHLSVLYSQFLHLKASPVSTLFFSASVLTQVLPSVSSVQDPHAYSTSAASPVYSVNLGPLHLFSSALVQSASFSSPCFPW